MTEPFGAGVGLFYSPLHLNDGHTCLCVCVCVCTQIHQAVHLDLYTLFQGKKR